MSSLPSPPASVLQLHPTGHGLGPPGNQLGLLPRPGRCLESGNTAPQSNQHRSGPEQAAALYLCFHQVPLSRRLPAPVPKTAAQPTRRANLVPGKISRFFHSFLRVLCNSPSSRRTDVPWTKNDSAARSAWPTMTRPCRPTSMTSSPPTRRSAAAPVRSAALAPTPTTCSPRSISTLCRTSLKPQKARFAPVRICGCFFAFWDGFLPIPSFSFRQLSAARISHVKTVSSGVLGVVQVVRGLQRSPHFVDAFLSPFLPALDSSMLPLFSSSFRFC